MNENGKGRVSIALARGKGGGGRKKVNATEGVAHSDIRSLARAESRASRACGTAKEKKNKRNEKREGKERERKNCRTPSFHDARSTSPWRSPIQCRLGLVTRAHRPLFP